MYNNPYIKSELKLFPNQVDNVKALIHKRRCILSDKTGAGKTCSCLYAFSHLKYREVLNFMVVLTPLSAYEKKVWEKDIVKFFNIKCIDIEDLNKRAEGDFQRLLRLLELYPIVYAKHSNIKQEKFNWLFKQFNLVEKLLWVVDEVHEMRNSSSSMYKLYKDATRQAYAFWGITATTISRNLENLYAIVNLVYPWYLGSWSMFRDVYCTTKNKVIGYDHINKRQRKVLEVTGIKDPEALKAKLEPIFITGKSFLSFNFHYVDYTMDDYESGIYSKIAQGIASAPDEDPMKWFNWVMQSETQTAPILGNVERYSNRFIYLQLAADGIIEKDLSYTREDSIKITKLLHLVESIVAKNQSVLIYFDYLATVNVVYKLFLRTIKQAKILLSTGESRLEEGILTERSTKIKPHVVLCTRASAASTSYYFINNVIFFHIPTIPSTFIQFAGRIRRKNTLFPDDLNCFIFRSQNIDLYKYYVCVEKTVLQEQATGEEENSIPSDYKQVVLEPGFRETQKDTLLWRH